MDVFGPAWAGHPEAFFAGWEETVNDTDVVLIPGDISWAMNFTDALVDLQRIADLPGKKVLLRGNHDYWWPSISRLRRHLPPSMYAIQNDALQIGDIVISGSRGWMAPGSHGFTEHDEKIWQRELARIRLSLEAAEQLPGTYHVVMMHFPPTNVRLEPNELTELLVAANPDALVFGHVHSADERVLRELGDIAVHFVAADALRFIPALIKEFPA